MPFGDEDRAWIQISRHRLGIERGGHHHHRQIRPLRLLKVLHQSKSHIAEQVALMELIKDHRANLRQSAIILQPAQQDALCDKADARTDACVVIKANLIAHLRAQLAPALRGHTCRHGACRHATRLQHHDHLVSRHARIQQHLRYLCRLARARRSHQHQPVAALQRAQDVGVNFPNGERGGGRHEVGRSL